MLFMQTYVHDVEVKLAWFAKHFVGSKLDNGTTLGASLTPATKVHTKYRFYALH